MTQDTALSILKTGANVFLTGEPGAGKTHTINQYIAYLRDYGIEPSVTASTGIAATHIGGVTIHSWSGIGIKSALSRYDLDKLSTSEYLCKRIKATKVLIIDEVSMLSSATLSMVDLVCKELRQSALPFGGLQVIFVGDFFQLPPIVSRDAPRSAPQELFSDEYASTTTNFAYNSRAWQEARPIVCYLSEQHRHSDGDLTALLSAIRSNDIDEWHTEILESRKITLETIPKDVPKLYTHNFNVDTMNEKMLGTIKNPITTFAMTSKGKESMVATIKKGCLSPEKLDLKIGAEVMFTKNSPRDGFVNGSLGTVTDFASSGYPLVELRDGTQIEVLPMDWTIEENGVVKAKVTQLPLRLAWAITVHKSQGMSMDGAVMDLSSVFEYGQGYVALSRVRKLEGLHILGWNAQALAVNPEVVERDHKFIEESIEAEKMFEDMPKDELLEMQKAYVDACGGKKKTKAEKEKEAKEKKAGKKEPKEAEPGSRLYIIRQTYPNAYRPWKPEDDEMLIKLFEDTDSIPKIVKAMGRQKGSIHARLIKHGLIEDDGGYVVEASGEKKLKISENKVEDDDDVAF